jgi:phosphate transport system substrate-binding protein
MGSWRAAILAALFIFLVPAASGAQDVTLRSRDGSVSLTGTVLGFDGEFYRIDTVYGELTVDASGVTCDGVGCPSLEDFVAELRVSGSATIAEVLLPGLIEAFAQRSDYSTRRIQSDDTHFTIEVAQKSDDRPVGRFHFRATNTDEGFADLLADEADIVMALREIRRGEAELAEEVGLGDLTDANRSRVVALDAIVPVVSPVNPVDSLSLA